MTTGTGYAAGGAISTSAGVSEDKGKKDYWSLSKCKKAYLDYLGNKTEEINEQKDARRYYHGAHWTNEQLLVLKKRRQPPSTKNRIARKIDGTIGLIERLRQDPKAFPRTPQGEQGAELATAVLRYVLDEQQWKAISPECARDGAIDGIGGVEIEIKEGDHGDKEVGFDLVEPDSFFYDPRSYRGDFSDAQFMGQGKWTDVDTVKDMFPDHADEIDALAENNGTELTSNPDRENKWFSFDGKSKMVRLVDVWYKHKKGWCWAIFTGSKILMEGRSYLYDEKNKEICKYIMFSCNVDHDGDRYGFVRNMKSSQDSLNFKHSKLNHILATRRLILTAGSVTDIEKTRTEWARDDGVVVVNANDVQAAVKADDRTFDFTGWAKLLEEEKQELDNYGPNQALIGDIQNQSGRAIQLLQQAGMAELGPYIMGYRGWKLRVYRAIFNAVTRYWQAERWIRVTDDEGVAQFVQVNGVGKDPATGFPTMVNALGSLDVDIILDEGPDTVNAQADVYETMQQVLPAVAQLLTPQQAQAALKVLIDTSQLPGSAKKQFRDASQPQQPDPLAERAKAAEVAGAEAKVGETQSKAILNMVKAHSEGMPDQVAPQKPEKYELPPEIQNAQALADINDKYASADHKRAQARHIDTQAALAPVELVADHASRAADRDQRSEQAARQKAEA